MPLHLAWSTGLLVIVAVPATAAARALLRVVLGRDNPPNAVAPDTQSELPLPPNVIDPRSLL